MIICSLWKSHLTTSKAKLYNLGSWREAWKSRCLEWNFPQNFFPEEIAQAGFFIVLLRALCRSGIVGVHHLKCILIISLTFQVFLGNMVEKPSFAIFAKLASKSRSKYCQFFLGMEAEYFYTTDYRLEACLAFVWGTTNRFSNWQQGTLGLAPSKGVSYKAYFCERSDISLVSFPKPQICWSYALGMHGSVWIAYFTWWKRQTNTFPKGIAAKIQLFLWTVPALFVCLLCGKCFFALIL